MKNKSLKDLLKKVNMENSGAELMKSAEQEIVFLNEDLLRGVKGGALGCGIKCNSNCGNNGIQQQPQ